MANTELNPRCDDTAPTDWRNGGGLYICVEALKSGSFVAAICNLGKADDTPSCAGFQTLNDGMITTTSTDDCPRAA